MQKYQANLPGLYEKFCMKYNVQANPKLLPFYSKFRLNQAQTSVAQGVAPFRATPNDQQADRQLGQQARLAALAGRPARQAQPAQPGFEPRGSKVVLRSARDLFFDEEEKVVIGEDVLQPKWDQKFPTPTNPLYARTNTGRHFAH